MKTNYVLIDYENVQPASMSVLAQEHFKVIVFVGTSQAKIAFEVASALQHLGSRAEYVKISGSGPNALDFHIAFYIGQLAAQEPGAYFHIISKDTGFDPLIQHLKTKKVMAARWQDVADIPLVKIMQAIAPKAPQPSVAKAPQPPVAKVAQPSVAKTPQPPVAKVAQPSVAKVAQATSTAEKLTLIIANLRKHGAAKPRTVTTLSSTINSLFQKKLSEKEVSALVQQLQKQGIVTVNDTKVSYSFPG